MERENRISYFKSLKNDKKSIGSMDIYYKNERKTLPVYEINLDYLIYNRYNGRIASLVKSYEKQTGQELDSTNPNDIKIIEDFLWNSNIPSNKATEKNMKEVGGQLKYGIVTLDGVIIDGNRRARILRKVYAKDNPIYFRAVVLDETIDENPKEIMRLETTYQMGEDAKVDYNAVEKYLKCKDLTDLGFSNLEIANMMAEHESRIEEYLSIMDLMNDYLDKLNYNGIYTRLDKTEGAFVDVNAYLDRYKGRRSKMIKWHYNDSDLLDLKLIYFDFIRGIYNRGKNREEGDSKDYRYIGQTSKKGSFFANQEVWENFRDRHFNEIDPIREIEPSIDQLREQNPTQNLDDLFKNRDETYAKKIDSHLKRNMGLAREALGNLNKQNEPLELLLSAKGKLESINTESEAFLEDDQVYQVVDELRKLTETFKTSIKSYKKTHK